VIKTLVKPNCEPQILVITPLKEGDSISRDTKKSLKRNKTPFEWISVMGKGNAYKNTAEAYRWYRKNHKSMPPFVIKIDNDLTTSRGMLDKMYNTLLGADKKCGYSYSSFEFYGAINFTFPARRFDPVLLQKQNYISSCSLIRSELVDRYGFITDDSLVGLLDWCFFINLLNKGYVGIPVKDTHFKAFSTPTSVSCWPNGGYEETVKRVLDKFVNID